MAMRVLTIFFFVLGTTSAYAQYSIHGTIRDANDNSSITGASIYIPDLKKGTLSDVDGGFTVDKLPRGRFLVQFKFIGYAAVAMLIDTGQPVAVNILLTNSVTELNEIVISGISHSTELKKNPIPIATLSSDLLNANASTNIIENVAQEPGVYHVSTGVAVAKPVIRGLGYNRIITLYDGIRQEGQQWGDEHGIEIDEYTVDRVEIIKGAGSLLYGSDGLGGVINFFSANPVAMGSVETRLISNYQSNNGLISNSIVNSGNKNGFYWLGRFSQKTAHAYKNAYDGYVFNSGFDENDFTLSAGLNKSWGFSQVSYSFFHQNIGLVEGERDSAGDFLRPANVNGSVQEVPVKHGEFENYSIEIPSQHIDHQRIASITNIYIHDARFQLNLGYQKNVRKEFGDVLYPDQPNLYFDLQSASYNLTAFLPPVSGWDFSVSTSGMRQQNFNRGLEFLIPEYRMFDWGTVLFAKKNFKHVDFAGGIRFDHRTLSTDALFLDASGASTSDINQYKKFSAGKVSYKNYSASAGLTYEFSKFIAVKFNASRGFRAPNISELTSNGIHEGSLRFEYGNYGLKPETSLQADLGMTFNSPHISAEVSVYRNGINHYIYTRKLLDTNGNDSIPDSQNPFPAYTYTQGKARLTGGEFSIDLHPHPLDWLHFENALSIVYATNQSQSSDSSKYLPFTPAPRWQSEIRTNTRKWKNFANMFFKVQFEHYWEQNRVLLENGTETPTPAYGLWNAGFGLDVTGKKEKVLFSFYFTAENVFDKAYQNNLSRLRYADENELTGRRGVFNMGRNYSFKLLIPLVYNAKKGEI
jgi:iron complex outermembrane receptor protein